MNKICIKCGIEKPLNEFHKQKIGKFGVRSRCKSCRTKENKTQNNPAKMTGTKICSRCDVEKHITGFAIRKLSPDGRSAECKQCKCEYDYTRRFNKSLAECKEVLAVGQCEICMTTENLVIDHNHETKELRGCLCNGCNSALGLLGDSKEILLRAVLYLEERGSYNNF